jgi:hypothetical protein
MSSEGDCLEVQQHMIYDSINGLEEFKARGDASDINNNFGLYELKEIINGIMQQFQRELLEVDNLVGNHLPSISIVRKGLLRPSLPCLPTWELTFKFFELTKSDNPFHCIEICHCNGFVCYLTDDTGTVTTSTSVELPCCQLQ